MLPVSLFLFLREEKNLLNFINNINEHNIDINQRWIAIAKTNIEQGFMALVRAIAKPESYPDD